MSKPEWGVKRLCPGCSALYYDMKKNPPSCPKCNAAFDPEALLKSRRKVVQEENKAAKKAAAAAVPEELEDDLEIEVEEVADDAVLADDDDAGEAEIEVEVDDKE
jgi:uncharacterized protein (TIGR02300 family)